LTATQRFCSALPRTRQSLTADCGFEMSKNTEKSLPTATSVTSAKPWCFARRLRFAEWRS